MSLFLTAINETGMPQGVIKPFVGYKIEYPTKLSLEMTGMIKYFEVQEKPELIFKKYYAGCLKNGDRLLVKRLGGAGDVIWGLPVIREIKQRYPGVYVAYWVAEKDTGLLEGNPYIDEIIKHSPDLKKVKTFDWILDYYETIERYNPAEFVEAYDIHWKWAFNETPTEGKDLMGNLFIKDYENWLVKRVFGEDYIIVALNSSAPKRTYFQMKAVVEKLLQETSHKIIISGDYQIDLPDNPRIKNLIGKTKLREFLALVNNAKLVVCTDSGNTHFAGQLKRPCVAIYSTVAADTRAKYYPLMKTLQTKEWCSPCVKLGEYCSKEPECTSRINVSAVWTKIKEALA